jgi:alkylation response protein AidB-like acyl-CoA dehydrogenase
VPLVTTTNPTDSWLDAVRDLPLPGSGRTWERWRRFAALGAADLVHARLGEGHADAVAIVAELEPAAPAPAGALGVWAAEAPLRGVTAASSSPGWTIHGERAWCSGAPHLDRALITAHAADGVRLFLVPLDAPGVTVVPGTWPAVGMAGSDSLTVRFDDVSLPAEAAIGQPGAYTARPGFWHGAVGVAACWYGGAVGVGRALLAGAAAKPEPHRLAHLGAVDSLLCSMADVLRTAAAAVDADPLDRRGQAQLRAMRVRASVERGCDEVLARTGRATGAGPLCRDEDHSRRVADLTTYLRQSHAEADLAAAGARVLEAAEPTADWLPGT